MLEGTLSFSIEGVERDMSAGELARVAPEVRRQLINRGPARLAILALGAAGEHVGRDGTAFVSWDAKEGAPPQETPRATDSHYRWPSEWGQVAGEGRRFLG